MNFISTYEFNNARKQNIVCKYYHTSEIPDEQNSLLVKLKCIKLNLQYYNKYNNAYL